MTSEPADRTPSALPYALAFLSTAATVSLLLGYFLWYAYQNTHQAVETAMRNIAHTVEARFDATLRRIDADLNELAAEIPHAALTQENRANYLMQVTDDINRHAKFFPELHSYRIYDANGDDLYISGTPAPRHNIAERAYFQCAKNSPSRPLCFSEAFVGKTSKRPAIALVKPLVAKDGRFIGVLVGGVELGYFTDFFSTLNLGAGGVMSIRRIEDGAQLARWPESPESMNTPLSPSHPLYPWLTSGKREEAKRVVAQTDGKERLYVVRRLQDYPYFISPGRTTAEYMASWRQLAVFSTTLAFFALGGLTLFLRGQWRTRLRDLETNRQLTLARDAAEAASRAKSAFLANMSHELRTPMNAIMGMTGLALRHATDPRLRDQLGKVEHASHHLLGVINDILDLSKIEAERMNLDQADFQLGEVLENMTSLIGHKAREKQLDLHIDIPPEIAALRLNGDALRLGQILLNLSGNALKFTEHGSIIVRVRQLETSEDYEVLCFEIADTGIGISAEAQMRLFSAFEQADNSLTRQYGGTGLGLAISKRLVEMMGGQIGVESQIGQGSRFWFTARFGHVQPLVGAVPPAPTSESTAEIQIRTRYAGARVLLAEDEPINREVSRGLLEDVGLEVDIAEDGIEALELAQDHRYALILMDMQMPRLNGIDATRAIRVESQNRGTPILAMTANAFDEDRRACLDAGMDDHIPKPIDPAYLYGTLMRWLDRRATNT